MNAASPQISVIIPNYNRPVLVQRAVESVLSQTYKNIELIVVDDMSPAPSAEALRGVKDPRLSIIRHNKNQGLSESRNTGIKNSHGEWIAFLDDDDTWLPEKLEKQLNQVLNSAERVDASVTDFFDVSTHKHRKVSEAVEKNGTDLALLHWIGIPPSTWLVNRKAFDDVGFFDPRAVRIEDWDWLLSFYVKNKKLAFVPESLTHYDGIHNSNPVLEMKGIQYIADKHTTSIRIFAQPIHFCFFKIFLSKRFAFDAYDRKDWPDLAKFTLLTGWYLLKAFLLAPIVTIRYIRDAISKKVRKS